MGSDNLALFSHYNMIKSTCTVGIDACRSNILSMKYNLAGLNKVNPQSKFALTHSVERMSD